MSPISNETAAYLRERIGKPVPTAVILGSGFKALVPLCDPWVSLPYQEIPHFPVPTVPGHRGCLHVGEIARRPVAFFEGRLHAYEGWSLGQVVYPVQVARALGAELLMVTNAAGGIHRSLEPGDFMLVRDHLNLMGDTPLTQSRPDQRPPFIDMSDAYDGMLRASAREVLRKLGLSGFEGVLAAVRGPCYETPAEIAMLRQIGADAVSMSAVPEVIMARALSMKVLGISLITNRAGRKSSQALTHEEVLAVGQGRMSDFWTILEGILDRLGGRSNERFPEA